VEPPSNPGRFIVTLGLIVTEAIEDTVLTKVTITTTRHPRDIITDGTKAKGIITETATSIAENIVTGTGITAGVLIAIEIGITGTAITTKIGIIGGERIAGLDQGTEDSMELDHRGGGGGGTGGTTLWSIGTPTLHLFRTRIFLFILGMRVLSIRIEGSNQHSRDD